MLYIYMMQIKIFVLQSDNCVIPTMVFKFCRQDIRPQGYFTYAQWTNTGSTRENLIKIKIKAIKDEF